jgi:hypothetical protein
LGPPADCNLREPRIVQYIPRDALNSERFGEGQAIAQRNSALTG